MRFAHTVPVQSFARGIMKRIDRPDFRQLLKRAVHRGESDLAAFGDESCVNVLSTGEFFDTFEDVNDGRALFRISLPNLRTSWGFVAVGHDYQSTSRCLGFQLVFIRCCGGVKNGRFSDAKSPSQIGA